MQFENGGVQILKSGEFDLGTRRNLMQMRRKLGFDLVIVDSQAGLLGSPARVRDESSTAAGQRNPTRTLWARRS
jgi:hypothetical protein